MINSISFSGGRTSAYLSFLFKDAPNSEFIFCDTGAEHPKTYEFIKAVNGAFNLSLTCLKAEVHDKKGKANTPKEVSISDIGFNLDLMRQVTEKYGGFTINRPWCTAKLKTDLSEKLRKARHGNDCYIWLGIRYDEPNRLVGQKAYSQLVKDGLTKSDISDLFINVRLEPNKVDNYKISDKSKELLRIRIAHQEKLGLRYMAEISEFTKQDVIDWWREQSFDLDIDEHLGNCVFCIKKSDLKIALAERDEPELYEQWCAMVHSDKVRLMPADKFGKGRIYRKWLSPEMVIAKFEGFTTDDLRERIYKTKQFDTGSCSESCEAYGELDQLEVKQNFIP